MTLMLLVLSLLVSSPLWAATRFVSPSGSGSACSSGAPCSRATAISQAVAGDTITLADGTYSGTTIDQRAGALVEMRQMGRRGDGLP